MIGRSAQTLLESRREALSPGAFCQVLASIPVFLKLFKNLLKIQNPRPSPQKNIHMYPILLTFLVPLKVQSAFMA